LAEVNLGLAGDAAACEAGRCISCGTCIACDTCLIFCPDVAISRAPEKRYTIAYDYCKGCGLCAAECPRAAMAMEEERQ
jgi:2-oxoacid:acceptor oxidoreductase delta subunit (pyruvate/2-ketoisovalerate family)